MAVFGWWVPVPGWRVVWCVGLFPLDPSLTPAPPAWCAVGFGSGRPSVGWWVSVGWWASVGCSSFLGGGLVLWVACLAGCVLVGLFSTWGRGCCSRWSLRFGRVFVGACSVVAGSVGCVRVGGLFSGWLCCSRWVGRPGRSGSSSPPSFSPHTTRQSPPDPRTWWVNSHVKTLTDRRSSVSGTHAFRLCRTV